MEGTGEINIEGQLQDFTSVSLEEINSVALMKRVDTKYLVSASQLSAVLSHISQEYKILTIDGKRLMQYNTLYFDTLGFKNYLDHHNGKGHRSKVRMRKYVESDICFLEIKKKNNLGVTKKTRCRIDDFEEVLSDSSKIFMDLNEIDHSDLRPILFNKFRRFTLVNKTHAERVTIDLGLTYTSDSMSKSFDKVAIIEVKQERKKILTRIRETLISLSINPTSFSKYCVGVTIINDEVKYNRFKELKLKLKKLNN